MGLTSASILLFFFGTTVTLSFADDFQTYKIENVKSDLVLDGTDHEVTIQRDARSDFQRWYLEPADFGAYRIINYGTKKAMMLPVSRRISAPVITRHPNEFSSLQKWQFNSDGTIVNAGINNLAAVVYKGRVNAGAALVGYHKKEINNQQFRLIKFPYE